MAHTLYILAIGLALGVLLLGAWVLIAMAFRALHLTDGR